MVHAVPRSALVRFMVWFLLPAWVAGTALPACAENTSRWPKLEEVIVVSKTHFDIGFTDLASRVVDRYRTSMADQALKLVDESRGLPPDQQFAWTLAGWPMAQVLWPGQTAERRDRFVAAMRAGDWSPMPWPSPRTPNRSTWRTWPAGSASRSRWPASPDSRFPPVAR